MPQVGPEAVLGIEINPYAAELARVCVWIGHIQWARRNGFPPPADPVLRSLETIECRDAVLTPEGSAATWPPADVIIGNPPFLGDKAMIGAMGADYTRALRVAYEGRVPGGADLVCYWFEKAREAVSAGATERAGLVATQSIRKGLSRRVLDRVQRRIIYEAWSDEPWTLDGAAVRVSLIAFSVRHQGGVMLNGEPVPQIAADLCASDTDVTKAVPLEETHRVSSVGTYRRMGRFRLGGIWREHGRLFRRM